MRNLEVVLVGAYLKCFSTLHFKIICISLVRMAASEHLKDARKGVVRPKPKLLRGPIRRKENAPKEPMSTQKKIKQTTQSAGKCE